MLAKVGRKRNTEVQEVQHKKLFCAGKKTRHGVLLEACEGMHRYNIKEKYNLHKVANAKQ